MAGDGPDVVRRATLHLVALRRVVDVDLEQEAIELGFGQRVGALLLDGVARREHLERIGQRVRGRSPTVTLRSCIAWRSAACVFGGVRLISSARTRFAKIGPGKK